jgi:hypothetical protein
MICCPPVIVPFSNALTTVIPYTADMQTKYGTTPRVDVFVYDAVTETYIENNGVPVVQVKFDGVNINIDNGGLATGQVKIS